MAFNKIQYLEFFLISLNLSMCADSSTDTIKSLLYGTFSIFFVASFGTIWHFLGLLGHFFCTLWSYFAIFGIIFISKRKLRLVD